MDFTFPSGTVSVPNGGLPNIKVSGTATIPGVQQYIAANVNEGDTVDILPALLNPHDHKAIEVHHNGTHIGHLPVTDQVAARIYNHIVSGNRDVRHALVTGKLGGYDGLNLGLRLYVYDEDGRPL